MRIFTADKQKDFVGWDSVIAQHRAIGNLKAALEHERVAHAYLFHGPDGVGKRAAALAMAQALECTEPDAPCGACPQCQKVAKLIHPDVHFMMPQPSDVSPEAVRERLLLLAEDPYVTVDFLRRSKLDEPGSSSGKQVQYAVSRINEDSKVAETSLRRLMSFRSVEGVYKVAILSDAELLRQEAANAFLKLLEEPTPNTVFILTTSRPDRMMPTILSRCQHVRFDRLSADEIATGLVARGGMDDALAAMLARMADGSFSRALDLASSEDLFHAREEVLGFLRASYVCWSAADKMAEQIERLSGHGREYVKFVLELMLGWVRDLALVRSTGHSDSIVNSDQAEAISKFSASLPEADPAVMADLIEQAIQKVERNVHLRLLLTVLAQSLRDAMLGRHQGDLLPELTHGM